jgi:rod shape-determining protein MreC
VDQPLRGGRARVALLLVLASITVVTLDARDTGPVQDLRGAASTVFSPLRGVGEAVTSPFRNGWHGVTGYDDLEDENEELRREVDRLKGDAVRNQAAADRLQELEKLERLPYADGVPTVAARVISGPLTSFDATFEINRGSGEGVKEGMAVVTEAGLVGRITRVYGGRSHVQLVTDPQFEFGIQLIDSGDIGVAKGDPQRGVLTVDEGIDKRTTVEEGSAVISSGIQRSAFPPDVPVGRVTEIGMTEDQTEQTLTIEPLADLTSLTYVKVMLWESP